MKKCIVSQLCLASGRDIINGVRIYRSDSGLCKGDVLKGNDCVWPNLWYVAILNSEAEPKYAGDDTPDSMDKGWGWVSEDEGMEGPQ